MATKFQQMEEREARLKARRRRWLIRSIVAATGLAAGYLCGLLPEDSRALCHLAAKIFSIFGKG